MTATSDPNNPDLHVNDHLCGYVIEKIVPLKEINAVLYLLGHAGTGARHVHISAQDQENTFGVAFKTVPTDSTGVAHILEHTVLCGSGKYPVRDPFFSMLKRSLSTFMNAFTASDWTMYPFSTQNAKDYYNLMDVYLDAAFFPRLDELSFKQEGHRLEFEKGRDGAGTELVYKGVVYNEMKGAMSSPDQVMGRSLLNALYPDTTYSNNSGGEPADIPKLTHAQLKAFHQRHYHPSNAYFYTYGNLPLKGHLEAIEARIMRRFTRIDPDTDVPPQPRWQAPRQVRYTYALSPGEDPARKHQACLAWLTGDVRDTFEVLVLAVLEQILLGNAASPLRKALMDSGLGSALSDATGYDAENRDTMFACGLKDVAGDSGGAVETIIMDVLNGLVRDRIDPELISSAIHQIEFRRREITNTPFPYGIKLLLTIVASWLHGGDPERILQLDADLKRLHEEIAKGPFLEGRLKHWFLDNPHRVSMLLSPDTGKAQAEEERTRRELAQRQAALSEEERRRVEQDARKLARLQESPEDVSVLPTLALSDIPPRIQGAAPDRIVPERAVWCYSQPTSGIFYFSAAAGAAAVPADLQTWVPFFCYAVSRIGTDRHDYAAMARRIDAVTGGVGLAAQARTPNRRTEACLPLIHINAKCLTRNLDPALEIVDDLLASADFRDLARLKQLLGEYRAAIESTIVHNGHRLAISLSSRAFLPAAALEEKWSGATQISRMRAFPKDPTKAQLEEVAERLAAIAAAVFAPDNVRMAAVGEAAPVDAALGKLLSTRALSTFTSRGEVPELPLLDLPLEAQPPREGWSTSTAVAFVARTIATAPLGHPDAPALAVLAKLLRSLYLHREIREKGGAYGGFAVYSPENGLFSLASYRDPHIVRTLQVFDGVQQFFQSGRIEAEDIKEAVLQVCSDIDKPDPPGPAARKAFSRLVIGLSDDARLEFKRRVLEQDRDSVLGVAARYFDQDNGRSGVAVIAGKDMLAQANAKMTERPLTLNQI